MGVSSLSELYKKLDPKAKSVYVVPLIRYNYKKSDYLYLLYKEMIEANKEYEIKSTSVFGHYRFVAAALFHRHIILHYHWLEFQDAKALAGMPWKLLCISLFKLFGGNLIWTVHNKTPHGKKYLKFHFRLHKWMSRKADLVHVHCQKAEIVMAEFLDIPRQKMFVFPHPVFPSKTMDRASAFEKLNAIYTLPFPRNKTIFLMFGQISTYKGIENVLKSFSGLEGNSVIIIAGPVKKGNTKLHERIQTVSMGNKRMKYIPEYIPEDHIPYFFNAADACILNYDDILTSAGAVMAISYQKPLIAPDLGCISELKELPNVRLFSNQQELQNIIHIYPR